MRSTVGRSATPRRTADRSRGAEAYDAGGTFLANTVSNTIKELVGTLSSVRQESGSYVKRCFSVCIVAACGEAGVIPTGCRVGQIPQNLTVAPPQVTKFAFQNDKFIKSPVNNRLYAV